MKKTKATFFADPGHGWLAVKRQLLKDLGILNEITGFSYQKGSTVYLEEDCDVSTLYNALKAKHGINKLDEFFEIKTSHTNNRSAVRSYASFNPNKVEEFTLDQMVKVFGKVYRVSSITPEYILVENAPGLYAVGGILKTISFTYVDLQRYNNPELNFDYYTVEDGDITEVSRMENGLHPDLMLLGVF